MLNMGVWDFSKPMNELSSMKNVQEDRVGILKRVPWYAKADSHQVNWATTNVNFLHSYFQASAGSWAWATYLIGGSNNWTGYTLQYRTTGAWTALTGGTYALQPKAELSAVNYLDKAFIVGYDATAKTYLAPATITGTVHATTDGTALDWMPSGRYIVRYRDLLYVLYAKIGSTIYPSRAYYNAEPVDMAIPADGWDTPYHFEQFGQDDWDEITWGAEAYDKLVVFKSHSMWTYDEENVKKIADIGCDSYKSIKVINGILYWANRDGIWRWAGDLPQLISGKVQPLFNAIDQTKLNEMVASNYGFEYRLFVWTLVYEENTYTNCWICFDVRREKFYVRCTYHKPLCSTKYIESWVERMYFWSDTWYVYKQSTYVDWVNSDDWNEIDYFFITNALDFGWPEVTKNSPSAYFFTHNTWWMNYVVDVDHAWEFNSFRGQIDSSNFHPTELWVSWNRLSFKFYGKDKNKPFEFEGFVLDVQGIENVSPYSTLGQ